MYYRSYFSINHVKILHNLVNKRSFSIYNGEIQSKLRSGKLTYYDVLSVPQNADKITIREAYLKLVKLYHPDTSRDKNSRLIFICIKESHDVLTDSGKRRLYDQKLRQYKLKDDPSIKKHRAGSKEPFDLERWERYKRYTSGTRHDSHEDNTHLLTIGAIFLTCVVATLLCLIFGEVFVKLTESSVIDDVYEDDDVKHEHMVNAFFNPISLKWERIIAPFEAPTVAVLKKYYKLPPDEPGLPKNITTIEMPRNQTNRPTILYDPRKNKPIIILQN
ncbi:molecular chaperone [Theileria orientalis]|uniref:Molecular chaperone n=1 Tax=Theileria orientalis TaxID=68886 RepID=A0A976XJ55_THEOR|nr:molecular chaperone [Theileria orientalis]